MNPSKRVYVISDLHIGGKYNDKDDTLEEITKKIKEKKIEKEKNNLERGFRICNKVRKLTAFIRLVVSLKIS